MTEDCIVIVLVFLNFCDMLLKLDITQFTDCGCSQRTYSYEASTINSYMIETCVTSVEEPELMTNAHTWTHRTPYIALVNVL